MVLLALLAGLGVKYVLDRMDTWMEITWMEFAIGGLAVLLFVMPVTTFVGFNMAKNSALSFNEYWNGYELSTQWQRVKCTKNGPCAREYQCDPWTHIHTNTDSDGNMTTTMHTHWDSCPYTTEEWVFTVKTTLGDYVVGNHWLPDNPNAHRWRASKAVPASIPSGTPKLWQEAKNRVDAGRPGPVTKRMPYENYILASDKSILKEFSTQVGKYEDAGLLPRIVSDVHTHYYADKVSFVGFKPKDAQEWQKALMYLNAGLGEEMQGDLHLVVVHNDEISRAPDAYINALKAYWSDSAQFGDNAISKNSIIVVVGTDDGKTVSWARATTGMPLGNERMEVAIKSELPGTPLGAADVIGNVEGEFYTKIKDDGTKKLDVRSLHAEGKLERIIWGLDDSATQFIRISMSGNDLDDVGGGFLYLDSEIEPTTQQKAIMLGAGFVLSLSAWIVGARLGIRKGKKKPYYDYY